MKITKLGGTAAALALAFGVVALPAAANAVECVPADAYTEHIEHPAVGEPTIEVPNPDYVPAVEEVTEVVHHEAEFAYHDAVVVEHPAVTETQWKYTRHGGPGFLWLSNNAHKYVDGSGNPANWKDWLFFPVYERTSHTQEVTISEAWTETISEAWTETVSEAWDETVVVTEAQPAQGEPTIIIDNPDYVAAWIEDVQHEAVVCDTPPAETPEPPSLNEKPSTPTAASPDEAQPVNPDELAVTGAGGTPWGYTLGALGISAAALGAILVYGAQAARRR